MAKNLRTSLKQSIRASSKAGVTGGGIFSLAPLDLRFALLKTLDPRVTFTRASTGTYVGSDGVLRSAVTNLVLRSEEFDNASWTANEAPITANQIVAPNGLTTADLYTTSANTGVEHYVSQVFTVASSTIYTASVYVKAGTSSVFDLQYRVGTAWVGGNVFVSFNLSTQVATITSGTATASITPVGNGWFRCGITATSSVAGGSPQFRVATGDGGGTIYLWGAQLEQSSTVGEYIPTTSTINSAPRFDHNPTTGESLGLLVEEARTNLLLNSATLSTQSVTAAAVANTLSFYGTGTVTLTGVSTAGPLVGTGANNRVSLTFTPIVGVLVLTVSGSVTNAQLEAGAFATSYIPTTTATATRAADVASVTGANFSSWYNQTEGTVFAETQQIGSILGYTMALSDGTDNNRIAQFRNATTLGNRISRSGTATNPSNVTITDLVSLRSVIAARAGNATAAANGTLGATEATPTVLPTVDRFFIGLGALGTLPINGTIKRLTYWPVRLANPTLQSITQ